MVESLEAGEVKQAPEKLSAAEKKKLRRKRAKESKKQLKSTSVEFHKALHEAQSVEAQLKASQKVNSALPTSLLPTNGSQTPQAEAIEYVAEPLTALEDLSNRVEQDAIDSNPYGGLPGLEVEAFGQSKREALQELQRIAEHFKVEEAEDDDDAGDNIHNGEETRDFEQDDDGAIGNADGTQDAKSNREIKRKRNELTSQMIAQLKQDCPRPEVVEFWDIRARDPKLLVYLKSYRNTVPVPRHWSQKRKYLQGKRGIEKPPFELPSFINATGISNMRNALEEKVQERLKNKGKQRMRPKMGKMDIDYSILHDAFFKYQDKPKMTLVGDLYYEGKEYEMKPSKAYPGIFSEELQNALGMTEVTPPPWLINMQRYGPPPSYPSLKIPGLNAPIPSGSEFGYHPGGWGKPPVDHDGTPLYGDVFGVLPQVDDDLHESVKQFRWGELEDEDEESSEEEEVLDVAEAEPNVTQEQLEQGIASGMVTGLASSLTDAGIVTDQTLDMRKSSGTSTSGPTPALYTIMEQQKAPNTSGLSAVDHTYKMPGSQRPANATARKRLEALHGGNHGGDIEVAIDPELLEKKGLEQLYRQQLAQSGAGRTENYSDMVADNAARKRKMDSSASRGTKKTKDSSFKF